MTHKILHTFLSYIPTPLNLFDLIILLISNDEYKL